VTLRQERQAVRTRDKRQEDKVDKEARKTGDEGEILEWTHQQHKGKRSTIFTLLVFISCVVVTIHYPPSKGKNIAMDEQDKNNTDSSVAETVDADPAPEAEVTVEATPPPAEVIDQTKNTKWNG
jgi:hypothetical protein